MKCEYCGAEQESGKFCAVCGMMMTRILVTRNESTGNSEEKKVFSCRYCGHQQQQGLFCDECGMCLDVYRPPQPEEEPMKCPECGTKTMRLVCPNCGTRIYRSEET